MREIVVQYQEVREWDMICATYVAVLLFKISVSVKNVIKPEWLPYPHVCI